jgi:hypothetical protein
MAIFAGQGRQCGRQIVPYFLCQRRKMAVVEGESAEIFNHAQTLRGPVGRGVEDAKDLMFGIHCQLSPLAA